jgi:hypothetical protein
MASRTGTPYIATSANCPISSAGFVTKPASGDKTLVASNGTQTRINVYASDKSCLSSYNFATSFPGSTGFVVNGLVATKDSVFIRYQHPTTPVIAKCDFDGTIISSCAPILNDSGFLGVNSISKELVLDDASNTLYYSNWDTGSIMQINSESGYVSPLIRDAFTMNASSISVRPQPYIKP